MEALIVLVFWVIISIIVGVAANSRGRNGVGWFLVSVFLSPILALLFLLAFPPIKRGRGAEFDDTELRKNILRGRRESKP